jgi:hypothetical protein
MDDPTVGPSAPMKLKRACECNRLEKQLLITAYECLAPIIEGGGPSINAHDQEWRVLSNPAARKRTRPLEATIDCVT